MFKLLKKTIEIYLFNFIKLFIYELKRKWNDILIRNNIYEDSEKNFNLIIFLF